MTIPCKAKLHLLSSAVLLMAALGAASEVQARCPLAQDLTFIPAQPAAGDQVRIRLRVYLSVLQYFWGERNGNLIELDAITNSMTGTLPPAQDGEWSVGALPAGSYQVRMETNWWNMIPPTVCPTVTANLVVAGTPAPPTPARAAPALSAWALGLVAAVLALLGGLAARRRA
jgi:hypothetical protein